MNGGIVIYGVPNDVNNQRMREKMSELRGINVTMVMCPPSVRELYRVPFIVDEAGGRYFGVEGIEGFVSRRVASQNVA